MQGGEAFSSESKVREKSFLHSIQCGHQPRGPHQTSQSPSGTLNLTKDSSRILTGILRERGTSVLKRGSAPGRKN